MPPPPARVDRALELFHAGCACSQAVFAAYSDLFGINEACAMRLSCGLGAGVGRLRNVCGAVSAMALLAGLKYGSGTPGDAEAKRKTYEVVRQMAAAFQARHGSIICRELLGTKRPETSAVPSERTAAYYAARPCARLVADAASIIETTLLAPDAP
ncbi:MAG: C-GCAxxG-C-C family protein [Kiritimatiellia bacterium]|nr:C-GCAxxG-C-C family protein [Kiritimatiellia bacterium]